MLKYLQTGDVSNDPLIEWIEAEVDAANEDARWTEEVWSVSTIEENDRMQYHMGLRMAKEQGEQRVEKLIDLLLRAERIDDIQRQIHDVEYRESLFREYGI